MSPLPLPPTPADRILARTRSLPRAETARLLDELLRLIQEPHCAWMQADGVPCPSPRDTCENCGRFQELLETVRARLERS